MALPQVCIYSLNVNLISMKKLLALSIFLVSVSGCKVIDEIKKELYVKVTTISPDDQMIGQTVAALYGDVSDDGGKAITEKGIVLSRNPNPTVSDTKILAGYKMFDGSSSSGMGKISVLAENLIVNTKYYYKAYCINSLGTSYGEEYSFTTKDLETPKLTTELNGSTTNSISVTGILANTDLIGTIISYGFYYSLQTGVKDTDPYVLSTSNNKYNNSMTFTVSIPSLLDGTTYYIKSFVKTARGITLGPEIAFKTLESPVRIGLRAGLQAYFNFNNNSNDVSQNKFEGIPNQIAYSKDRFGIGSSAISIQGNRGSRIVVPKYFGVTGKSNRTISIWSKIAPNSIFNHSHMFGYGGNPFKNEQDFGMFVSSLGSLNNVPYKPYVGLMAHGNGGGYVANQFANIQDGNWHHYLVVVDFSINSGDMKTTKLYIDGKLVNYDVLLNTQNLNTGLNLPLVIGQFTFDGVNEDYRPFCGELDDLGIWNRVLTDTEIQYLYQNNFRP